MVSCTVIFENNPQKVFYSGDVIRGNYHLKCLFLFSFKYYDIFVGTVQLTLNYRKKIRGVYIRFKGYAQTEWYEDVQRQEGTGDNRRTVTDRIWYRGHENHLYSKTFFVGSMDGIM